MSYECIGGPVRKNSFTKEAKVFEISGRVAEKLMMAEWKCKGAIRSVILKTLADGYQYVKTWAHKTVEGEFFVDVRVRVYKVVKE